MNPTMTALAEQVNCYRRLAKLAMVQHQHIQHSRTEELLAVLRDRQEVLDQLAALQQVVAPAKAKWNEFLLQLTPADRRQAETLLAETRQLLEQITAADKKDVLVLQQRKLNLGRQIAKTSTARQVNRNYAAAAYGTPKPKMDFTT